jgi:hypothetical protein
MKYSRYKRERARLWMEYLALRHPVSVMAFGAKGERGHNDAPAIQAALDFVGRYGDTAVVVDRPLYVFDSLNGAMVNDGREDYTSMIQAAIDGVHLRALQRPGLHIRTRGNGWLHFGRGMMDPS